MMDLHHNHLSTGGNMHFVYSFAVQAAEVEGNKFTGEVSVLNIISANDIGMAINLLDLQRQIEGRDMMGLGHCLTEKFIVERWAYYHGQLARYRVPGIALNPEITSIIIVHPSIKDP
jgi:CO/xanthine dehydrogenase Mo-binding subunit